MSSVGDDAGVVPALAGRTAVRVPGVSRVDRLRLGVLRLGVLRFRVLRLCLCLCLGVGGLILLRRTVGLTARDTVAHCVAVPRRRPYGPSTDESDGYPFLRPRGVECVHDGLGVDVAAGDELAAALWTTVANGTLHRFSNTITSRYCRVERQGGHGASSSEKPVGPGARRPALRAADLFRFQLQGRRRASSFVVVR